MSTTPDRKKTSRSTYRQGRLRPTRRAQSHDRAQAELETAPAVPDHPLIPAGEPALLTEQTEIDRLLDHIREVGQFAYDTEFIGELSYYPQLCVVQIATHEQVALIDPLAGVDLTGVWRAIADPAVETIVHAGQQDLEPVARHLGCPPANIFDVQIAAGFVGLPYPIALSKLVRAMMPVSLGKRLTFTHWDERPLPAMHLRYAADDVRYLPALRAQIQERLEATGHAEAAREECAALEDMGLYVSDPRTAFARVRGHDGLKPRQLAILRELMGWRDAAAREHDLPPRTFLRDEILLRLAREPVKGEAGLANVRGLPRPVREASGRQLVEAIAAGQSAPKEERPGAVSTEETPSRRVAIDSLLAAAMSLCLGQGVWPSLVVSRQEISQLYRRMQGGRSIADLRVMRGWRASLLGDPLVDLIRRGAPLVLRWHDGRLRTGEPGEAE